MSITFELHFNQLPEGEFAFGAAFSKRYKESFCWQFVFFKWVISNTEPW